MINVYTVVVVVFIDGRYQLWCSLDAYIIRMRALAFYYI